MKKFINLSGWLFVVLAFLTVFVTPAIAQATETGDPAWVGTVSMVATGLLVVLSAVLGTKYFNVKQKVKKSMEGLSGILSRIRELFYEIKIFIDMVPAALEDDRLTEKELRDASNQLKLILEKIKAVYKRADEDGVTDQL